MKRTYQPSKVRRTRKFGLSRSNGNQGGPTRPQRRRAKRAESELTASDEKKPY